MGVFALVHQGRGIQRGQFGQILLGCRFGLGTGGVKEVEHRKNVVRSRIPAQAVHVHHCLIAHGIEPAAHVIGDLHPGADGIGSIVGSVPVSVGHLDRVADGRIIRRMHHLAGIIQTDFYGYGVAVRLGQG